MENVTRISENEVVATDPVTGGTWRVIGPALSREAALAAIEQQIEDTGARPARGTRTTVQFQIRTAEEPPHQP